MGEVLHRLGKLPVTRFMRDVWQRKPLLVRNAIDDFAPPVDRQRLFALACDADAEARLIEQRGGRWHLQHSPLRRLPSPRRSGWRISVLLPNSDSTRSTASVAVRFLRSNAGLAIYAVDMTRGPGQASPRRLLQLPAGTQFETNQLDGRMFEVRRDGRRFLLVRQGGGDESGDLVIVQNFFRELRAAFVPGREPQ